MSYQVTTKNRLTPMGHGFETWMLAAPTLTTFFALNGPNVVLGLYAAVILLAGTRLVWRPGEPPVFFFIFFFQWLQSSMGVLYGNATGQLLADLTRTGGQPAYASALMLTGVLVLAFAMRLGAGRILYKSNLTLRTVIFQRSLKFWFGLYISLWILSTICEVIAPLAGALRLPFLTMSGIKWPAFALLTFVVFSTRNPSARTIWFCLFGIEFASSIGGYFSSFKEVFFWAFLGLLATTKRLGTRVLTPAGLLIIIAFGLGVVWTAVKVDFRSFSNAGTGYQVSYYDYSESVSYLFSLVASLEDDDITDATEKLVKRFMYHEFFGVVTEQVPGVLPYAGGQIWGEAISRPFMPRLLFPDKRAINDSELTNQYTGLNVAGVDQGTSISLGYMAEAYIDYGPYLMFASIAGLGLALGASYRWFLNRSGYEAVVGIFLAPFVLMPAHLAETSILKMIPSLFLAFLAAFVVLKLLAPLVFQRPNRFAPQIRP